MILLGLFISFLLPLGVLLLYGIAIQHRVDYRRGRPWPHALQLPLYLAILPYVKITRLLSGGILRERERSKDVFKAM